MNELLKPLEQEHSQLAEEQAELDALSQALESSEGSIDALTRDAEELMRDLHKTLGVFDA